MTALNYKSDSSVSTVAHIIFITQAIETLSFVKLLSEKITAPNFQSEKLAQRSRKCRDIVWNFVFEDLYEPWSLLRSVIG